ncbi:MAG: PelD GGDEF domain-containing protein [Candidatus Nitrospinota bacterium M3_3B_026]
MMVSPARGGSPLDRAEPIPGSTAVLESAAITAAAFLLGLWLRPGDPFFVDADFPWVVLAPTLAGLRFGFAYGFGSALAFITAISVSWRLGWFPMETYPDELVLGLLLVGMICGEFTDMWTRKLARISMVSESNSRRLDEFTRAYHLLKISHDGLERRLAGSAQSLREALLNVRRAIMEAEKKDEPFFGLGGLILDLLAAFGGIQAAALHDVNEEGGIRPEPAATLGRVEQLYTVDPLASEAVSSGEFLSVRPEMLENGAGMRKFSSVAALPLVDVDGKVWGVAPVYKMPFMAFHEDNFRLLAVLGGHIGDLLAAGAAEAGTPEAGFRRLLARAIENQKRYRLPSTVAAVSVDESEDREEIENFVVGQRRGLDQPLTVDGDSGRRVILMLMPFTSDTGFEGYRARIGNMIKENFGKTLDEAGVHIRSHAVRKRDDVSTVIESLLEAPRR